VKKGVQHDLHQNEDYIRRAFDELISGARTMSVLARTIGPDPLATREAPLAPEAPHTSISNGRLAEPPAVKAAYPPPAPLPTQVGQGGVRFDFNQGARLLLPPRTEDEAPWRVRLLDLDSGNLLFESENRGAVVTSSKRFYVRFRLEIFEGDDLLLGHDFDCRDKDVLIQFPIGTLGDILAWFPYADKFQRAHGCRLTCAMSALIIPLLERAYPNIEFVTHEEMFSRGLAERFYATYSMGLFFEDKENNWQPTDFRHVGLHRTAGYILGVDPAETPPRLVLPDESRPIAEPYVCVAVQSSSGCKMWNNPQGWREVVSHLKDLGYRVICIDQKPVHGSGLLHTHIPHGVEDETGDRPLAERARWLRHADLFVGLSSGLAWLAWAAGTPVVMISGFTHPTNEFSTPYRVINWHACNSCWNDPKEKFQHHDFMWCPRHQNTNRHFECTRLITGTHVKAVIDRAVLAGATRLRPKLVSRQ
jgi:autotransporter strand-loop-strand O-heptosyltransferase